MQKKQSVTDGRTDQHWLIDRGARDKKSNRRLKIFKYPKETSFSILGELRQFGDYVTSTKSSNDLSQMV